MSRTATIDRKTKESEVFVELDLDGTGANTIDTGVPFFDHMLAQLSKHSGIDLGELDREAVEALATKWLPAALEMEKPLKADRELISALQLAKQALTTGETEEANGEEEGNCPF